MLSGLTKVATVFAQSDFDEYARLSGDDNPIHVDPEFASKMRFGRTAAHGMHLFSVLQAAIARQIGGPIRLQSQEFIFSAPTHTSDALILSLEASDERMITEVVTDSTNTVTVSGVAHLGGPDGAEPPPPTLLPSDPYKGLEVGMTASRTRRFTTKDVSDFLRLVADPNPLFRGDEPELPPGLLTGMDSWVLGVDLPGRGTSWLKQRHVFHQIVRVPVEVTSTVTITRIRPDKGLVNLATRCTTSAGTAVSGEALVLAMDIANVPQAGTPPPGPA
jgi:acyl dehydratase